MLINVLAKSRDHIAVAFDLAHGTFRPDWPSPIQGQSVRDTFRVPWAALLVREVVEALAIPTVSAPGYEADDVIATLASEAVAEGIDVLFVTADRDALQLVGGHVTVLMTRRGSAT